MTTTTFPFPQRFSGDTQSVVVTREGGGAESARPENDGQRKLWLWKMAKCKTGKRQTDFLANFG